MEFYRFKAIGYVETAFQEPTGWEGLKDSPARIVLDPELVEGLTGMEPGLALLVVFVFHRSAGYDLQQHPRGDPGSPKRGVFTLRSPRRPNPIGITQVELLSIDGNVLTVLGLDAFNGTPVLDLKPAREFCSI